MQTPEELVEYTQKLIIPLHLLSNEKQKVKDKSTSDQTHSQDEIQRPKRPVQIQEIVSEKTQDDSKRDAEVTAPTLSLRRQLTGEKPLPKKPSKEEMAKKLQEFKTKIEDIEKLNNLKNTYKTIFFYNLSPTGEFTWEYRIDPIYAQPDKPETRFTPRQAKFFVQALRLNDYPENAHCYGFIYSNDKTRARVIILLSLLKNKECYKPRSGILSFMKDENKKTTTPAENSQPNSAPDSTPVPVLISDSEKLEKSEKPNESDKSSKQRASA